MPGKSLRAGETFQSIRRADKEIMYVDSDDTTADVTYIGYAYPGSGTDEAVWKIKKVDDTTAVTKVTWADGDTEYNNVWDDIASLSYS